MKINFKKLTRIKKSDAVKIHSSLSVCKGPFYKAFAVKETYLGEGDHKIKIEEIVISSEITNPFCYVNGWIYDRVLHANVNMMHCYPSFYSITKTKEEAMFKALELQKKLTRTIVPTIVE